MAKLGVSRDEMHRMDAEALLLDEKFCRWLFTHLSNCGMFEGYFHSADAVLAYGEGRRSLGLDMLTDLAAVTRKSKEEVLLAVLAVELKTQKEVQSGRRNRNYAGDRNRELGNGDPDDVDGDDAD